MADTNESRRRAIEAFCVDANQVGARNLGNFQSTFVEKDGREYLIGGRSYMSQTIVDLDRGIEYEPDGDHFDGHAFCWADCWLSPDGNTLAVDGCVWACPYEYRFFDFHDPARGWPSLPLVGDDAPGPSDTEGPRWQDDGAFVARTLDIKSRPRVVATFERRGDHVHVTVWRSDAERARVDEAARAEAAHAA